MAQDKEVEILIIKVSRSFKQKIRQRAKKGHFGTITNYLRSVLRADIEASENGPIRAVPGVTGELVKCPSGMVLVDANTQKIKHVDDAYAAMHGYSKDELIGKPISDMYPASSKAALEQHIVLLRRAGHHTYFTSHQRKDGSIFTVLVEIRPVMDQNGVAENVVAYVRPVNPPIK